MNLFIEKNYLSLDQSINFLKNQLNLKYSYFSGILQIIPQLFEQINYEIILYQ
jgi:hypothetical protein